MKCEADKNTTCMARQCDMCMEHLMTDTPTCSSRVPLTNADRIRNMSDEELANELTRNPPIPCRICEYWDCKLSLCRAWTNDFTCTTGYAEALTLDWLKAETEGKE